MLGRVPALGRVGRGAAPAPGRVEGRVDGAEGRVDGAEGRVDGAEGRVDGMEGRLIDGDRLKDERDPPPPAPSTSSASTTPTLGEGFVRRKCQGQGQERGNQHASRESSLYRVDEKPRFCLSALCPLTTGLFERGEIERAVHHGRRGRNLPKETEYRDLQSGSGQADSTRRYVANSQSADSGRFNNYTQSDKGLPHF